MRPDRMKRRLTQIGAALAVIVSTAAIATSADARDNHRHHDRGPSFSFGFSAPGYYYEPAPRYYYAPAPRYYYAPPPAYYYEPVPPPRYYERGPSFHFGIGTNR